MNADDDIDDGDDEVPTCLKKRQMINNNEKSLAYTKKNKKQTQRPNLGALSIT